MISQCHTLNNVLNLPWLVASGRGDILQRDHGDRGVADGLQRVSPPQSDADVKVFCAFERMGRPHFLRLLGCSGLGGQSDALPATFTSGED